MDAKLQRQITKTGQLRSSKAIFAKRSVKLFGPRTTIPGQRTIAALSKVEGAKQPNSQVISVGDHPDGFGNQVLWDLKDEEIAVVIFLNSADYLGIMISGVKQFDTIEFVSATGIASFAEGTANAGISALIGVVATGANLGASAFGHPEVAPLINAGAKFAQDRFKEKQIRKKRRDPFGEDPQSGHKARQEGGVVISLPEAGRTFYSGDGDHKKRWIKKPGTRDTAHRPDHMKGAIFLDGAGRNRFMAGKAGDIFIYPWDHIFDDNLGFYRLHVLLRRGQPPIIL